MERTRFSKSLIAALCFTGAILLPCLIVGAVIYWRDVSPEDAKRYHELMAGSEGGQGETGIDTYQSKQQRERVQKDAFYMQGPHRLRLRITADSAQIVIDHQEGSTQIIEHMNAVSCMMQEELYYVMPNGREALLQENGRLLIRHADPQQEVSWADAKDAKPMQVIRTMQAETASYYYKSELFLAEQALVSRYAVAGHNLPASLKNERPLMQGRAAQAQFSLNGKKPNFQASQFKASLFGRSP